MARHQSPVPGQDPSGARSSPYIATRGPDFIRVSRAMPAKVPLSELLLLSMPIGRDAYLVQLRFEIRGVRKTGWYWRHAWDGWRALHAGEGRCGVSSPPAPGWRWRDPGRDQVASRRAPPRRRDPWSRLVPGPAPYPVQAARHP